MKHKLKISLLATTLVLGTIGVSSLVPNKIPKSNDSYENKNGIAPSEGSKGPLAIFNIFDPSLARGSQRFALAA
mgnify:CR=1 FL=1